MSEQIRAYTGGVGRKVHAGAVVHHSKVRNGEGVIALCGVYERDGGSWVAQETAAPVDCPECKVALGSTPITSARVVVITRLNPAIWEALGASLSLHSSWQS